MLPLNVLHHPARFGIGLIVFLVFLLSGCGGGGGGTNPPAVTLHSIAVTPANPSIPKGLTSQCTATGTYSDGTTADITTQVTWTSAAPATANVGLATGIVTGVAIGATTITASKSGITSPVANITVTSATLLGISITPQTSSLPKGAAVTFTATGSYSDSSTGNISGSAIWTSSNTAVATLSPSGIATALLAGSTSVNASLNGITSNIAILTVTPNIWASKAPMPVARYANTVTGIGNLLYAVGGTNYVCGAYATLESFDPVANTWTARTPMPTARWSLSSGVVNGILYAVGGTNGCYTPATGMTTVEAYNPVTDSWVTKAPMSALRSSPGIGVVNGILYAVGGAVAGISVNTLEAYDPATNTWTNKASMQKARYSPGNVGVVNGIIYAVGGDGTLNTVEAYNPTTNTWIYVAPMPTTVTNFSVAVVNSILYVVGGSQAGTSVATTSAYNPLTNSWSTVAAMPTARQDVTSSVVNNILYAVGGFVTPNAIAIVEAYTP